MDYGPSHCGPNLARRGPPRAWLKALPAPGPRLRRPPRWPSPSRRPTPAAAGIGHLLQFTLARREGLPAAGRPAWGDRLQPALRRAHRRGEGPARPVPHARRGLFGTRCSGWQAFVFTGNPRLGREDRPQAGPRRTPLFLTARSLAGCCDLTWPDTGSGHFLGARFATGTMRVGCCFPYGSMRVQRTLPPRWMTLPRGPRSGGPPDWDRPHYLPPVSSF